MSDTPEHVGGHAADGTRARVHGQATERSRERTMHIGELAERTGLSLRTIRHYDEVGVLPATARTEGGFRVYTEDDLERLIVIRRMKPLGFSLEETADLLRVLDDLQRETGAAGVDELRSRLAAFRETAVERRATMVETLARADEFIDALAKY